MSDETAGGAGIIVRWILIIVVILLTAWALYNFLIKPVFSTFGGEGAIPAAPLILLTKGFKIETSLKKKFQQES